jgi:ketosteroid isomerase-like protein
MRTVYEAFSHGDLETLQQLIAPEFVWHIPGQSPVAGDHRGFKGLAEVIAKMMELSEGTLRGENHDTVSSPEHGVNLDRLTATRGNRKLDMPMAFVAHIEGGRVTEAWDMPLDTRTWDEFWS